MSNNEKATELLNTAICTLHQVSDILKYRESTNSPTYIKIVGTLAFQQGIEREYRQKFGFDNVILSELDGCMFDILVYPDDRKIKHLTDGVENSRIATYSRDSTYLSIAEKIHGLVENMNEVIKRPSHSNEMTQDCHSVDSSEEKVEKKKNGIRYYDGNGRLHHEGGPTIEFADGTTTERLCHQHGKLHRTDGPTVDCPEEGRKEWYIEGKKVEPMFHECKEENGTKEYYNEKGEKHRTDGPAVDYDDGHKAWYQHGKIHRTDGPAIEWADGTKKWFLNGKHHRTDGPAIERADGDKEWWVNGKLHRIDGPAIDWPKGGKKEWYFEGMKVEPMFHECKEKDGTKEYFNEKGQLHHTHGPAIERANGDTTERLWYQNGVLLSKETPP